MTPTPQEHAAIRTEIPSPEMDGERIVISGMSGLFPSSRHVKELSELLYNKVNPISDKSLRWKSNHPEVAKHGGSVPSLERFDAQFFKVHFRLGNSMDPMSRKILEQAYQAIYDAGVNPEDISGKKVGVFIGTCFSEAEKASFYDADSRSGLGITGCCKAMFANRISYMLNAKGPSMAIDEACCSSTAALEQAYLAMTRGECEAAIVGGCYLCLHPQSSVHYGRITKQCMDGKTKSFDENADGCAKSEAINVLFLQKSKDALRAYADLMHAKTEYIGILKDETGPKYGFFRDPNATVKFLNKFYEEAGVPPHAVEYVEAFGAGVPEADKTELECIDEVICKQKDDTLFIGSVMSNIGYGEAASGISSITKVLLGYHTGELAANLHCTQPRKDVKALGEGRMRIVTEHQRFNRSYTAVNGMSVTGVNSHVLLHGHYKPKDLSRYASSIPHLVTVSARQDSTVKKMFDDLKSRPIDAEELALFHNIHTKSITGHLGRGFVVLKTNSEGKTVSISEKSEYFDDARRPLWFVYSGMGSQWAGMGAQLMRIPIFAAAIERCRKALEPKGIDIIHIITSTDPKIFDNILHSFVGIAAVQIGLTDILKAIGLVPDGIIGHSVGELGCAYADGCLTAEELILSAYSRGLVSVQTPFIRGSMAAIGLGYEQISKMCPPEIEVACHNGPESSTISGPADVMREFVAGLTASGIFAKEVPCSNIAYHSRYIADAGPGLLKYLTEVIKTPRKRSERWVSTSVPKDKWENVSAQYSSAEYHTNNLLNPVLFEETLPEIPSNAVLVEVAPHGLLQAILKRSLPQDCKNIALTRRGHPDNTHLVLEGIGKLYMEGYYPKIDVLYPKVEMPVSTGTPFLSHHIEWAHGEKWALPNYRLACGVRASSCTFIISLHDKEYSYLRGNIIEDKTVFPYAATLVAVWDTLAMSLGATKKQITVEFSNVHLFSQPIIHDQNQLKLRVTLHKGSGQFEVFDENIKVATGVIVPAKMKCTKNEVNDIEVPQARKLSATDIYSLLGERGYSYSGEFQSIESASTCLSSAAVHWRDNWVTIIDSMLQLNTLKLQYNDISLPTYIRRLCIDMEKHEDIKTDNKFLNIEMLEKYDFTRCGGIIMENISFRNAPAVVKDEMALYALKFLPSYQSNLNVSTCLNTYLQIVAENLNKESIKVVAITNDDSNGYVFNKMQGVASKVYGVNVQYERISEKTSFRERDCLLKDLDLVVVRNLTTDDNISQLLHNVIRPDTFVISEEDDPQGERSRPSAMYRVVSTHGGPTGTRVLLARWRPTAISTATTAITMGSSSDLSLLSSARSNLSPRHRLLIVAPYPAPAGLKNLIQTWRKDTERNIIQLIMVNNDNNNNYLLDDLPNIDLAFNVFEHGEWGGEYYVPIQKSATTSDRVILQSSEVGDYNALSWVEGSVITEPKGIPVNVHYAGISNRDVQKANGTLVDNEIDNAYGMDFSGTTDRGERVMGIVPSGAASSQVQAIPELLWPVPKHWSLEDAATVPLAYALAFYCLAIKSKILKERSVFVHGGSGSLGQAVISVALSVGCNVFTTVSDNRKKHFLRKLFPELKEENIGNSRDDHFGDFVLNETNSYGCEIVISTAKGDLKNIALKVGSYLGIIMDLTQIPNQEEFSYGFHMLNKARSYATLDFSSIFTNTDELLKIQTLMSEGIAKGYVRPLSRVTYAASEMTRAFNLLAASKHRGRVLLRLTDAVHQVKPRFMIGSNDSHLVLLDEENFGLQLVYRLVELGVRKIHLQISNSKINAKLQMKLQSWSNMGVKILLSSNDLNTEKDYVDLFHKTAQTGPIQGVYYIVNSDQEVKENVFAHLDSASRKLCPKLRYFAVINVGGSNFGQQTCATRLRQQLPATMVSVPKESNNGNYRSSLDATLLALRTERGVIVAKPSAVQRPSLLQQVARLGGITISADTPKILTLQELGITNEKLNLIASHLRVQYHAVLDEKTVASLTLESLIHFENSKTDLKNVQGLATFFSYIDSDELLATTEVVFQPTLTSAGAMRDDEFDTSESHLCIVPGMEGHHERFRILCERLKLPALVVQPGLDRLQESVRETAERYAQILLKRTGLSNNFYLMGYETGILVAIEIAKILETYGFVGTVYCLGCSPGQVKSLVSEKLSEFETDEQLENAVIEHMFNLIFGYSDEKLGEALRQINSWQQKVEACVQMLRGRVSHSMQYARSLIQQALARIQQVRNFNEEPCKLRSRIVLLRAADVPAPVSPQSLSEQPVDVHDLGLPLAHATLDTRCAAIINNYLEKEILEEFEKKNICDMYLLNPNTFMTTEE